MRGYRIMPVILLVSLLASGASRLRGSEGPSDAAAVDYTADVDRLDSAATKIEVSVDPRVELMSIIFRLAGHPEYNRGRAKRYIAAVEEHFGPHRTHPVVKMAAELRRKRGVSYDAVMSMAAHIKDANSLAERVPFEPRPKGLDARWRVGEAREFLVEARDFVVHSKFDEFIKAQQAMYDRSSEKLRQLLEREARLDWFDEFFGARPKAKFRTAIGMVNGPSCYGAAVDLGDSEELYCILGAWKCGLLGWGEPEFDKSMLATVVHEFCHSYTNSLVDAHLGELEASGERLFERVGARMKRIAYGNWQIMMRESLVRACVVRYLYANEGAVAAEKQVASDRGRGFLWVGELAGVMGRYERQREKYRTVEDFFPEIVSFFDGYELPEK